MRTAIRDFVLANELYAGAVLQFWRVAAGVKTAVLVTLYSAPTGTGTLENPQTLTSDGRLQQAVYIDEPVIITASGLTVGTHDTGIIQPAPTFRVNPATSELEFTFDGGLSWNGSTGFIFRPRGAWVTATAYKRLDVVTNNSIAYFATSDHTAAASIATDISAGRLVPFNNITVSVFGASLIAAANAAAARALLSLNVDAKGDIYVATADDTVTRKAVGAADGMVLSVDSSQSDGLLWALPSVTPAQYRLSLASAIPVPGDLTGQTTLYNTPCNGKGILIPTSTGWVLSAPGEMSQATTDATKSPAAVGNNLNYDLFTWNDNGTVRTTRGPAWTAGAVAGSDILRGTGVGSTELQYVDGRLVNKNAIANGPAALRGLFVGTVRSDGSAQLNDTGVGGSSVLRYVWNKYNRVARPMIRKENTASWTYTTATWRQANASTANQLNFVRGLDEDAVTAFLNASFRNATTCNFQAAFGLDSTTAPTGLWSDGLITGNMAGNAVYQGLPGLGKHSLMWLEISEAVGTGTWYGNGTPASGGPSAIQSGIQGSILA